jgi:group I intron endonuclease
METAAVELLRNPHFHSYSLAGVCGIYCFIHRDSGMCYVGSSRDIRGRIFGHLNLSKRCGESAFMKALRAFGVHAFDFEVLEECALRDLPARENFYIALMNSASIDGFNTREKADPLMPQTVRSIATRQRIGATSKGRKFSAHTRAIMSAKRIGKVPPSPDIATMIRRARERKTPKQIKRNVFSIRLCHRIHTPESKLRIAEQGRRQVQSEETKRKRAAHHIGAKRTAEQRLRMSIAQRSLSAETLARIEAGRRRPRSDEARKRMSEGRKAANAARLAK